MPACARLVGTELGRLEDALQVLAEPRRECRRNRQLALRLVELRPLSRDEGAAQLGAQLVLRAYKRAQVTRCACNTGEMDKVCGYRDRRRGHRRCCAGARVNSPASRVSTQPMSSTDDTSDSGVGGISSVRARRDAQGVGERVHASFESAGEQRQRRQCAGVSDSLHFLRPRRDQPGRGAKRMQLLAGTSGYSYKEWKGTFYPEKLAADGMLRYYAERFPTVEINNTFYRMPGEAMLTRWAAEVPDDFTFTLKAPQRITHQKRLQGGRAGGRRVPAARRRARGEARAAPLPAAAVPEEGSRGARRFPRALPAGPRRSPSSSATPPGRTMTVYEALRGRDAMLCTADTDEGDSPPLVATAKLGVPASAPRGVQRRRTSGLGAADRRAALDRAYVYFKHEDEGLGPKFAARFAKLWEAAQERVGADDARGARRRRRSRARFPTRCTSTPPSARSRRPRSRHPRPPRTGPARCSSSSSSTPRAACTSTSGSRPAGCSSRGRSRKGRRSNPADKRLAVPTEDHTFEYASFEGVIPAKQYGAGEVIVWDCGAYSPDEDQEYFFHDRAEAERRVLAGLEKGKLSFFLRGVKLKGSFALVRTSDRKSWLLIKHKDRFVDTGDVTARGESVLSGMPVEALKRRPPRERIAAEELAPTGPPEALPAKLAPMLAESADARSPIPAGSTSPSSTATACSRSSTATGSCSARGAGSTTPAIFPEIAAELGRQLVDTMVLDGEIVAFGPGWPAVLRRAAGPGADEDRARDRGSGAGDADGVLLLRSPALRRRQPAPGAL